MRFDFEGTKAKQAVIFPIFLVNIIFWLCFFIVIFLFITFLFPKLHLVPLSFVRSEVVGWLLIFLSFLLISFSLRVFYFYYLMSFKNKKGLVFIQDALKTGKDLDINLVEYLTYDSVSAIFKASLFTKRKSINLSHNAIFLFLLENKRADFIFSRLLINKDQFKKSLEVIVESQKRKRYVREEEKEKQDLKNILINALNISVKGGNKMISFGSLFAAIIEADKILERLFFDYGSKKEDIINVAIWEANYHKEYFVRKPFSRGLRRIQGIADDWTYGYTPILSQYAKEVSISDKGGLRHIHPLGRNKEIRKIEEILSSSQKNNVILVGEPGVGRENIILGFAKKVKKGKSLGNLKHKKLMMLNMNLVISRSAKDSNTVALIEKIFSECASAGNIILIIENLHNFIGKQEGKDIGSLDISAVITSYLESNRFQLIATTDHSSYHSKIEAEPAVAILLEKVEVIEPTEEKTILILEDIVPMFERRSRIFISYHALLSIVSDSASYIQNIPFPEKAISLLSEIVAYVSSHKIHGNIVTQDHVSEVISQKTGIPLGRIEGEEKAKLLNMEELIHNRIIGQDYAVSVISEAMRRVRSGISERKRPIGTFLFLGPTGVGKTETAKALANVYFGSEDRMIRLDMSEYQDADSVKRLIGSIDNGVEAQFANKVRENPFSLVLLDEFEKSHPDIANLFLQVLDEGYLTDAYQRKISFRNTIIIATSNAGAEFVREYILSGQNQEVLQEKLVEYLLKERIFKPEFINRFDAVAVFEPLTKENIKIIAKLMLDNLSKRLEEKGMKLKITDDVLEKIADIGYSPMFGAREMRRTIQDKIENKIANDIIEGKYEYGSEIIIDPEMIS
jgi:ATP-dependent Clp protease ATP-binding subunit ClpC